jgi:hypothetical protein
LEEEHQDNCEKTVAEINKTTNRINEIRKLMSPYLFLIDEVKKRQRHHKVLIV